MKQLLVATAISTSLLLGACATTGGGGGVPPTILQIIQDVRLACGFVPTEQTITQIIASLFAGAAPTIAQINQIVGTICSLVPPATSAHKFAVVLPYYPGTHVRIRGTWHR